jgi:hypothetical protein
MLVDDCAVVQVPPALTVAIAVVTDVHEGKLLVVHTETVTVLVGVPPVPEKSCLVFPPSLTTPVMVKAAATGVSISVAAELLQFEDFAFRVQVYCVPVVSADAVQDVDVALGVPRQPVRVPGDWLSV